MMATVIIEPHLLISHLHGLTSSSAKISADSRLIVVGDIFFAYPVGRGTAYRDGRDYISAALANGAATIVFDPIDGVANEYLDHPQCIAVENLALLAGKLCAEWYEHPSAQLNVIGVTGTNGKTTVTQWLAQALDEPLDRAAVLGTLGTGFPGGLLQTGYTTPDAPRLQTQIKELHDSGAHRIAIEVSSHALDQERVAGLHVQCAVFTNLTQDHLDYHGTMAEYAEAKAKLFQCAGLEHAVINLDDAFGRELAVKLLAANQIRVWGYALSQEAFTGFEKFADRLKRVYIKDCALSSLGYDATFHCEGMGASAIHLSVLGQFNLSNSLAVWAVLLTQGFSVDDAAKRMGKLRPVSGRMELISLHKTQRTDGPMVVVDYAHTPDALMKVLVALRPIANQRGGKIWCVFGCGGDRDSGKRSQMGRIAEEFANHIVLTSDNPRSEDPESIIAMIRSGIASDFKEVQILPDRAAAIMAAVRHADTKDVVLVAGKGHESTQEIQGKKFDFSDQEHIRLAAGGCI
ncbi:UDP-N-acetylmuramoyl-L-alanyl-D-glutamate--2,6-diaminopimelate ligase [Polynucleobacter sp. AP-Nino-20-G2]|uniref:UDP-N-acetylmuramoyl-L-alanyl-D-glutamate--2, 6-diaminopimelate ligase n=1 Tax=Polynucleobacter sp. AP-Nino-20-G2 TaxID=2576917 RepID=UPI001BFD4C76|nr:UDP-N-acetylmuramoyl-L-alanyl-D-glutamate--2,6-diaminopimelate ligase [Polynucleobacter sp. AP-Nino-20-G2]QWE16811.1 UDP-N-acetylmuramoyl-L-alanyl-D-glutamate--2,6-diaminopimelate ligase [Polynucleobacter sp. AP-Nino-20-G2]